MAKFNFGFGDKNKNKPERDPQIDIKFNRGQILMFPNKTPEASESETGLKNIAKFLSKRGYKLTIGVYTELSHDLGYAIGETVLMTYMEKKSLYNFTVKIINIREAMPNVSSDRFEIQSQEHITLDKSKPGYGYDKYIFEVLPMTYPEKEQRREFFRMPLSVDVYYQQLDSEDDDIDKLTYDDLKFDLEHAEQEDRYLKLKTIDLSAGGFRAKSTSQIASGKILSCMLIVGMEALPATAKVLSAKQEDKLDIAAGLYDVRAIFYDMGDQVRDRIMRYIFAQQRQIQARFNRKKEKERILGEEEQ